MAVKSYADVSAWSKWVQGATRVEKGQCSQAASASVIAAIACLMHSPNTASVADVKGKASKLRDRPFSQIQKFEAPPAPTKAEGLVGEQVKCAIEDMSALQICNAAPSPGPTAKRVDTYNQAATAMRNIDKYRVLRGVCGTMPSGTVLKNVACLVAKPRAPILTRRAAEGFKKLAASRPLAISA